MNEPPPFKDRLLESRPSMFVVGLWLHRKGYSVEIPAFRIAPSIEVWADYLDDGDVFAFAHRDVRHRYEVKHLKEPFSTRASWPFGNRIFVDKKRKVESAKAEVMAWVTVSQDLRALAVIPRNTHDQWELTKVTNRYLNCIDDTYACPLKFADFERFDPWGV